MTVSTQVRRTTLNWTGVETSFAAGFPADKVSDVSVIFRSPGGVETTLVQGLNYTVSLASGTKLATVTPVALPSAPGTITIVRNTPALVLEVLVDGEDFPASVHQALHDRAAMRDAEFKDDLSRAITATPASSELVGDFDFKGFGGIGVADRDRDDGIATRGWVKTFAGSLSALAQAVADAAVAAINPNSYVRYDTATADTPARRLQARRNIASSFAVQLQKTANYTVLADDLGKLFQLTAAYASPFTLTLPSAVTVGAGWFIDVFADGMGVVNLAATAGTLPISRLLSGQEGTLYSDGANWRIRGLNTRPRLVDRTVSGSPAAVFIQLPAGYPGFEFEFDGVRVSNTNVQVAFRFATDGVPNFISTAIYGHNIISLATAGSVTGNAAQGLTAIDAGSPLDDAAGFFPGFVGGRIDVQPTAQSPQTKMIFDTYFRNTAAGVVRTVHAGYFGSSTRPTHLAFYVTAGTFVDGFSMKFYGRS